MLKKKILLSTLVLGSCIAGITQGAWQGGNYTLPFEYTTNNSDIIIDENLNISNFSGGKIGLLKINDYNNYIRWNEGKLYWYYNYGNTCRYQGEMDKMCIGALNQGRNPTPVPGICTSDYTTGTAEAFYNGEYGTEFETILVSNYTNAQDLNICFVDTTDNNTTYCLSAMQITDKQLPCYGTFEDLQSNINAQDSPFIPSGNKYTPLPMCYTIQQKIDSYPSQYNIEMCYSSNKIWSGGQFVTVTPKSMLELWPTYQEYVDDVNLYQNYCGNYVTTQQACAEAFTGRNEKRSIINKLYNQGQQTMLRSYDYCYLQLNFTEEQKTTRTNCTMGTGTQHGSGITTDDIIEDMQNHKITIIAPDGTTVYSGFWNKSETETGANLSYDGIIESLQSVRGKLTSIFYYRSGIDGIIPDYIIWILLLIVLFAVFKK